MTSQESGEEGKTESYKKCLMKITVETIKKRMLGWVGHTMRSLNSTKNGVVGTESSRKKYIRKTK